METNETSPLMTSWGEYETSVERLIPMATRSLAIFDHDLQQFHLERPLLHDAIQHFLRTFPGAHLSIAVQDADPVQRLAPRTLNLLRLFAHSFQIIETPPHLANLSDSLLLVDDRHALVRFHRDHARSRQILDDVVACQPYRKRFEEIWNEGGTPVSATTIGL